MQKNTVGIRYDFFPIRKKLLLKNLFLNPRMHLEIDIYVKALCTLLLAVKIVDHESILKDSKRNKIPHNYYEDL